MNAIPKLLIGAGAVLIAVGLLWLLFGKALPFGRLPGDISVERGGFRFYFPLATCIVLSVVLSLVMYVIRLFLK